MKRLNDIMLSVLFLLFLSMVGNAQEVQVKTSVLSPFINTLNLSTQFKTKLNSINITASYMSYKEDDYYYSNNVTGLCLTTEYRIHLSDKSFRCWFLAPFGRAMYYENARKQGNERELGKYTSLGLGFVSGKQYALGSKITWEWFIGPVVHLSLAEERKLNGHNTNSGSGLVNQKLTDFISNRYLNGYGFRCGINIGFIL